MSRYWTDVLEHGTKRGGQHKNHKYIARAKEGNKYRYFYTQEEIEAYKKAMNNMAKKTMRGDFGNGAERSKKLKEAAKRNDGDANMNKTVQARVNEMMLGKKKAAKLNKKLGLGSTRIEMISGTEKSKSSKSNSKKSSRGDVNVSGNEAAQRRRYDKGDRNADTSEGFTGVKSRKGAKGDLNVSRHEGQVGVKSRSKSRVGTAKGDKNVSGHEAQVGRKSNRPKSTWAKPWLTPAHPETARERTARLQVERNQAANRRRVRKIKKTVKNAVKQYNRVASARSRGDRNTSQAIDANSTAAARARLRNRRNSLKRALQKQWGL